MVLRPGRPAVGCVSYLPRLPLTFIKKADGKDKIRLAKSTVLFVVAFSASHKRQNGRYCLEESMILRRRTFLSIAAGGIVLPTISRIARAQTYPIRTVRIIVGFGAGSGA